MGGPRFVAAANGQTVKRLNGYGRAALRRGRQRLNGQTVKRSNDKGGEREPKAGWNRTMIPALRQGSGARLARSRQRTRQRIFALQETSPKLNEVRMNLKLQAGYEVALRGNSTWRVFFHVCNWAFGDASCKTWIQGTPLSFSAPECGPQLEGAEEGEAWL